LVYRVADAVLVRAVTLRAGTDLPDWPDLTGSTSQHVAQWRGWLEQIWALDGLGDAIEVASPVLARQARKVIDGHVLQPRQVRRVVMTVARYVLRASCRPTPFGLFAGIAPAGFGDQATARWGENHRVTVRPGAEWLTAAVTSLEACPDLLDRLPVVASNLCTVRDGRLVAAAQQHIGPDSGTGQARPVEVSVRLTNAVDAAIRHARTPILAGDLAARLSAEFPQAPVAVIRQMITELARLRLLITSLRAPMTVTDVLGHLTSELDAAGAATIPQAAGRARALRAARAHAARHDTTRSGAGRRELRASLAGHLSRAGVSAGPRVAVDVRLDAEIVLPHAVAREAEAAAAALTRLTPYPSGLPAWGSYHVAFLERYGPGALVPVLDLISPDTGLGFPATFHESAWTLPPLPPPARDGRLLALAYARVLDGGDEITLDDQAIGDLAGSSYDPPQVPPHAELFVQLHAGSTAAVQRGDFRLVITGASRAAGTTAGRFLDLLDPGSRQRAARAYTRLPVLREGAVAVQVSCPPVHARSEGVARAPAVLPVVISVAEHRPPGDSVIPLADLAAGGDTDGLYLVSLSRQQLVEPTIMNAVEFRYFSHPLARFLCEITRARAAVYMPFSWGTAATLPFLPRVRYRNTVLTPARWTLTAAALPGPDAGSQPWADSLAAWRQRYRVPAAVYLAETDNLLCLDLDHGTHRALLRAHLDRHPAATLCEAPGPDAFGWADGRAHEICVPLTSTVPPLPAPPAARSIPARIIRHDHGHLPGCSRWLYLKIYGHPARQDDILARVPGLLAAWDNPPPWWYIRYRDPDPHLRLRLRLPAASEFGPAAHRAGTWAAGLRDAGLAGRIVFDTYYPETGRYGSGAAMTAAETVFAADSTAALAQLACTAAGGVFVQALTAASLASIVVAFTGTTAEAMRWLAARIPNIPVPVPPPRPVHDQALRLAAAQDNDCTAVRALPGGTQVAAAWQQRAAVLGAYRDTLAGAGQTDPDPVLASLLHMHCIRISGIDPGTERACHRLARSAAVSWLARSRTRT
jgi:thiopeptide-type bacteriocin biosynthesis protein